MYNTYSTVHYIKWHYKGTEHAGMLLLVLGIVHEAW